LFSEGEEEIGSPSFDAFLADHADALAADVIVVADSQNWAVGRPALTTSLRGLVDGTVTVRTLANGVHSGMFGGAVPDAFQVLSRALGRCWNEAGDLVIPGLTTVEGLDPGLTEADLRASAGLLPEVELVGTGSLAARLWHRPALTITGLDMPPVDAASNTLPAVARAKFSLRVAPGQDPAAAATALEDFLRAQVEWGAAVEFELGEAGDPWSGDSDHPVLAAAEAALAAAWGVAPVRTGIGGSIPFIAKLQRAYPAAVVLVTGVEDPFSQAHGPNESVHVGELYRACLAQTL
jgi:acetylornithine deacetylase/succinyl-diaminopimelate desuccinylase-like protein